MTTTCSISEQPSSAASELADIAAHYEGPLIISKRDVRSWIDLLPSDRPEREPSRRRRGQATRQLFEHPSTPALASWLTRHAPAAKIEVALVEAHDVVTLIQAARISPEIGATRLRKLATRSWTRQRSRALPLHLNAEETAPALVTANDSLAVDAIAILTSAGLRPSRAARRLIAEVVDQGVDYLIEEAARLDSRGASVLEVAAPRALPPSRRASFRVAHGNPAGRHLRALVLGPSGLIHASLRRRQQLDKHTIEPVADQATIRVWTVALEHIEKVVRGGLPTDG